jgi:hypothetical protein
MQSSRFPGRGSPVAITGRASSSIAIRTLVEYR